MDYNDLYFEKQGYEKDCENERVTIYSMTDEEKFEHVVILHNESNNAPAYFHFSVEKYLKGPGGSICNVRIKDVEYEHLKNKAHNLMKEYIAPTIRAEKANMSPHVPMTAGIPKSSKKR